MRIKLNIVKKFYIFLKEQIKKNLLSVFCCKKTIFNRKDDDILKRQEL